jgi:putative endopeptidase
VRNVGEFYATFGVKEGDKLYLAPDQRAKIW